MLPNSPNVIMAAERAAELSEKQVVVVALAQPADRARGTRRATRRRSGAAENAAAIAAALGRVRSGSVAPAARDDAEGRFAIGEAVGFVGESLVAWGEPETTLAQVLASLGDGSELITCIAGAGAPLSARAHRGAGPGRGRARAPPRRPAELLVAAFAE